MHVLHVLLASTLIFAAATLLGVETGAAIVASIILGFLVTGVAYITRLFVNLLGDVDSEKAQEFREWLANVVRVLRLPFTSVEVVMSARSGEGYQLVYLAQRPSGRREAGVLESLVISSATRSEPIAVSRRGTLTVAIAGRIASLLLAGVERRRGRTRISISTATQLKLLYKLLRAIYEAARAPRAVAAYSAYKAIGALLREGLVWFRDWRLAEKSLSIIPAEPLWLRVRVVRQLRREQEQLIPP